MNNVNKYMSASDLQRRGASDVIEEFTDELATMHGICIDIGCGPGNVSHDLVLPKLPNDAVIVGVDILKDMIKKAREIYKNEERLSFFQLDIESDSLPVTEIEKYDLAVSFYCLHWCRNMRHTLENIYKLLRPGGHALMMFLSYHGIYDVYKILQNNTRYRPYMKDLMKYELLFQTCPNPRVIMKETLEEVGFEVLHCSNREKSFVFESMDVMKDHIIAINPFLKGIPDDLKDEYISDLTNEFARHQIKFESKKDKTKGYSVLDRYGVIITYFHKPDDDSLLMVR